MGLLMLQPRRHFFDFLVKSDEPDKDGIVAVDKRNRLARKIVLQVVDCRIRLLRRDERACSGAST
jgi:hypothetical protein